MASIFFAPLSAKMLTFASWSVKHTCFVRFHFFWLFYSSWFSFKTIAIYSKSILSDAGVREWWPTIRKHCYLLCFRHHFFKEADLGARIVREVCKFHFFDFRFYFLSKMSLTTVTHFRPLDPPAGGHFMSKPFVLLREFDVFFQNHQFY